MKYKCYTSSGIWREVEGIPVRFPDYDFDAFIYQNDGSFGLKGIKDCKGKFVVTEVKTGRFCSDAFDSPEQAYYETLQSLKV